MNFHNNRSIKLMKNSSARELIFKSFDVDKEKLYKIFSLYLTKSPLDALNYMESLGGMKFFRVKFSFF